MKAEALKRLTKINPICVNDFLKDKVMISDGDKLRQPDIDEIGIIEDIEERYKLKVYHVIKDNLGLVILFVSTNKDEWEYEEPIISDNIEVEAYCYNEKEAKLSDFGNVTLKQNGVALIRVE